MAKKELTVPRQSTWAFRIAIAGIFFAEIVVLPGAASPFRLPKEGIMLGAICLALVFVVVAAARSRVFLLPRGRVALVMLILPAITALSALWSASPLRALQSTALSLIWIAGIAWFSTIDSEQRRQLTVAASLGVVVSAGVMMLQLSGTQIFNFAAPIANKRLGLTGLTGNPADLAMAAIWASVVRFPPAPAASSHCKA